MSLTFILIISIVILTILNLWLILRINSLLLIERDLREAYQKILNADKDLENRFLRELTSSLGDVRVELVN